MADSPPAGLTRALDPDLGQLATLAEWVSAWRGEPTLRRPILAFYAGAHAGGDVGEARAFMEEVAAGDAQVSRAAAHLGAGLDVYDLALDRPLPPAPAMSERECAATMAFGMEVLAKQPDLLVLVGFGPGADASAKAVIAAIEAGAADPLEVLRTLGGRESAAVASRRAPREFPFCWTACRRWRRRQRYGRTRPARPITCAGRGQPASRPSAICRTLASRGRMERQRLPRFV